MWCTCYKSSKEIVHGGCDVGIVDEGGVVAERVHDEEHEIKRVRGFGLQNRKSNRAGLDLV